MSRRYKGGVISATAPVPTGPYQCGTAKGIWTLPQQMQARAANIWPIAGNIAPSSQSYTTAGTYSWVAPAGVTSVSVVVVGSSGYDNAGSALAYKNNISVSPGCAYTVKVEGVNSACRNSFINNCTVSARGAAVRTGDGGGNGGNNGSAGGGAGGYSGNGGVSGCCSSGAPGSGGGGGGGGVTGSAGGGPGGGVGLFGQGANGAGGSSSPAACSYGRGGSGGTNATVNVGGNPAGSPGLYGGGRGLSACGCPGSPGMGAVRILWPGNTRQFPSTCVGAP